MASASAPTSVIAIWRITRSSANSSPFFPKPFFRALPPSCAIWPPPAATSYNEPGALTSATFIPAAINEIPAAAGDAIDGVNRSHAILGTSDACIATHPSDMCVAMVALDAVIHTQKQDGSNRAIPVREFFLLPGKTPERETALEKGELINSTSVLPKRSGCPPLPSLI